MAVVSQNTLEILLKIRDEATEKLKGLESNFKKQSQNLEKISKRMGQIGKQMSLGALAKFNVVFGEYRENMMEFVNQLRKTMPASRREIIQMASSLQDLLVPMGISRDTATEMTKQWLFLTDALAAFNDVNPVDVLQAIKSGLVGASEPLRRFGIDARESTIEAEALRLGLLKVGEKLNQLPPATRAQVRAQALLSLAYKQSKDAVEGYEEQQGSLLRMQLALKADIRDLLSEMITAFFPTIKKVIAILQEWVKRFKELSPRTKEMIVKIAGLLAVIGPLLVMFSKVIPMLMGIGKALLFVKKVIALTFSHPILLLIYAVVAAFVYMYRKIKELKDIVGSWKDAWTLALLSIRETVIKWAIKVLEVADKVTRAFGRLNRAVKDKLNDLRAELKETEESFYGVVAASRNTQEEQEQFGEISEDVKKTLEELNTSLDDIVSNLPEVGESSVEAGKQMEEAFQKAVDAVRSVREEIEDVVNEIASAYTSYQKDRAGEEEKFHEDVADLVAKTELEIEDLMKKRNEAFIKGNREEVNDLNAQISRKQQLLQTYYKMQLDLEDEVAERKRYYQMNELEQLAYNHQKKMLTMQKEFLTEQVERTKRLLQLLKEQAAIREAIGKTTQKAVDAELEKTKTLRDHVRERLNLVKGWKDEVVNIYDKMVEDINRTLSGIRFPLPFGGGLRGFQMGTAYVPATGTYLLHKGEAVVPAYRARKELGKNLNIVVNVNGGYYLSDDAAEELGDKIVKKLKRTIRI